ncbi:MAG: AAA family ATPase [Pseudomonadota bacterium]
MIVVINGALGVGKSETAWALLSRFDRAVMLDGDYLGAVRPFDIDDPARTQYLYKTIGQLIEWHQTNGYRNFVINYVFEAPAELARLLNELKPFDTRPHVVWLSCAEAEHMARIERRNHDDVDRERHRARELRTIMQNAASTGWLGDKFDTTALSATEVAEAIYRKMVR